MDQLAIRQVVRELTVQSDQFASYMELKSVKVSHCREKLSVTTVSAVG